MPAPTIAPGTYPSTAHNALAAYVDDTRTGILARGRRDTSSSTTTTTVGVLRTDDTPISGGIAYKVSAVGLHLDSSVATDVMMAHIRYTTDGSTPTTSSAVLPGARAYALQANAAWPETRVVETTYTPASDETLSLLLCISRMAGTGNVSLFADSDHVMNMLVELASSDPGDSGTDI